MAISDILKDIGTGVARAGKAAVPVLQRVAEVESGQAPQLDAEKRARQEKIEDEQIAAKAQILENNLALGQKYGTLTPDQQQQYVDQISSLYSHPRHAATLMEKLRKAIHPQGAVAMAPQAALPNPVPTGGTAAEDARLAGQKRGVHPVPGVKPFKGPDGLYYQPMYDAQGRIVNEQIEGYTPPPVKSGGKSPPLAGNMLPADAVGANGEPIPEAERSAAKSFVEFGGAWWPVAPKKPTLRQVGGDLLLIDSQSGQVLRKIASANAKVTRHQTLQPGDDGQMHLVTLTSVSTPEGATIDVEPEEGALPEGQPSAGKSTAPSSKTPAKKVTPGSLLPKTGAKPSTTIGGQQAGPAIPGLSDLAHKKIQTTQDRQVLESSKQIIDTVDNLLPELEAIKNQNGPLDLAKQDYEFGKYKLGIKPSGNWSSIFENAALLDVVGASIWSRIGRSKYTFEVIRQHLPKPTDSPKLMYDKVTWLKEHVVPAAQEAILHPQPDDTSSTDDEFLLKVK